MYAPLEDADALVICTEWSIFRSPNFEKVKDLLKQPVIFDGRNLYNTLDMEREGFNYTSIGRNTVGL
jgi:UDPglucose 6-dehydrogenase